MWSYTLFVSALIASTYCQSIVTSADSSYVSTASSLATGASPNATVNTATITGNASTFATSIGLSVESIFDQLVFGPATDDPLDMWDLFIGPVEVAATNTTVAPTPVASTELIPPPPLHYPSFPNGVQNPAYSLNNSWSFSKDFWYGVASAAYQVEGAVKDEGRGPCLYDYFFHRVVGSSVANQTGDIADNHYYLYKQDIARIAAMGIKAYSFSISWSRILPFGRGPVNEQALAHYDDVINTCLQYNVEPIVTLYHWDLPLYLQFLYGGWLSEDIVPDFVNYANITFQRYGDRVTKWVTVNEPIVFCNVYPLAEGYFPPTTIPPKQQPFFCGQSVILAHSQAYRLYKSLGYNGTVSFKTNGGYKIPLTNSSDDAQAVQRAWDFNEGWFANPIFIDGDYPSYLKVYVSTFLRNFTTTEKTQINGSCDYFMHDAYTSQFYMAPDDGFDSCLSNSSNSLYPSCVNTTYTYADTDGGWNIAYAADPGSPWLHKATDWVPVFLHYIQDTWNPPQGIVVSEFGFSEPFEELKTVLGDVRTDLARSTYYRQYMEAILIAISEGVNVIGSLAWSILDNLEWGEGFTVKFGMQYVNFTTQERYYKQSFFEYINAFRLYQQNYTGLQWDSVS